MSLFLKKSKADSKHPGSFDELLNKPAPSKKTIFNFALNDKKHKKSSTPEVTTAEETEKEPEKESRFKWQSPFRFSTQKNTNSSKTEASLSTPVIFDQLDQKHKQEIIDLESKTNKINSDINNIKSTLEQEGYEHEEIIKKEKQRLEELELARIEAEKEAKGPVEEEEEEEENENDIPDESDELYQETKAEEAAAAAAEDQDKELHSLSNTVEKDTVEPAPSHIDSVTEGSKLGVEEGDVDNSVPTEEETIQDVSTGKFGSVKKKMFGVFGIHNQPGATPEEKHNSKLTEIKTKNETKMKTIETQYDAEIAKIKEEIQNAEQRIASTEAELSNDLEYAQAQHEAEQKEMDLKHEEEKEKFLQDTKDQIESKYAEIEETKRKQEQTALDLKDLEKRHSEQLVINQETENKLDALKSSLSLQRSQIEILEREKLEIIEKIKELNEEKSKKSSIDEKELENLEKEIKSLEGQISSKETETNKINSTIANTNSEIDTVQIIKKTIVEKLKNLVDAKSLKIRSQNEQDSSMTGLTSQLEELKKDQSYAVKEKELENKIKAIQKERENLTSKLKQEDDDAN